MRQSSKSPVYQGFSALQVEEVRSEGRPSGSSVQQALTSLHTPNAYISGSLEAAGIFLRLVLHRISFSTL